MQAQESITTAPSSSAYRGLFHTTRIPSSAFSIADLRRLYNQLSPKAIEAVDRYLARLPKPQEVTEADFESRKTAMRTAGALSVLILGSKGEQIVDRTAAVLQPDQLPEKITSVIFDSFINFQQQYGILLLDRFKLTLDLGETPLPQGYNPWNQPTPNRSVMEVIGADQTWVTGVHASVIDFFKSKGRRRAWLHSEKTFSALSWFIGIPGALWIVYRIDARYEDLFERMHSALRGAIDIYLFLLAFLVFRAFIYIFRWLFPLIELEGARSTGARKVLTFVLSTLLLAFAYDVLKTLFS